VTVGQLTLGEPSAKYLLVELADAGLRDLVDEGVLVGDPPLRHAVAQEVASSSALTCSPSSTTTQASGRSCQRSSGLAMTATSKIFGWAANSFSRPTDEIHSPPDLMTSFARSVMRM
jgi:hypothetical protein